MAITTKIPGYPVINLLLVGNSGVGRRSLKWRYLDGRFPEYVPIVYHIADQLKLLNGTFYYLDFSEIPGNVEYDKLRPMMYSKLSRLIKEYINYGQSENVVAVMCYAVNDTASFDRLKTKLIEEVRQYYGDSVPMILLGTKSDLLVEDNSSDREFTRDESQAMTQDMTSEMRITKFLTCSALSGDGVTDLVDQAILLSDLFRNSSPQATHTCKMCCCVVI